MDLMLMNEPRGPVEVITVSGDVDVYTSPRLREAVRDVAGEGRTWLVIDLSGCEFLDSTGLGVVVGLLKMARRLGGDLAICRASSRVAKTFAVTGLDKVLTMTPTADEAVAALAVKAGAR